MNHFQWTISQSPPLNNVTKHALISDVAKTFDVLGWFSPVIIKVPAILLMINACCMFIIINVHSMK